MGRSDTIDDIADAASIKPDETHVEREYSRRQLGVVVPFVKDDKPATNYGHSLE